MGERGQASIEFLLVSAAGLLLIVVVAFTFLSASRGTEDAARLQQVTTIGSSIIEQAGIVYALGTDSWIDVEVNLPSDVVAIYTIEGTSLVFDVVTQAGIVSQPVFSSVPITGVNTVGVRSDINLPPTNIHSGTMEIRVTSLGTQVEIRAMG